MNTLEQSGYYQTGRGESFLITQGVVGSTLIAGKQILIRVFLDPSALSQVDHVGITIEGQGKSIGIVVSKAFLIFETAMPNGPSVGVILKGFAFPKSGTYTFRVTPVAITGGRLSRSMIFSANFLPTKDLRLLVAFMYHEGVFAPTPDWTADVLASMARLGSMLPVRDCVQSSLNGETRSGLRFAIGKACDGWTATYNDCVYQQTLAINAAAGDDVDVTIEFRWGLYWPQWNPPGDPYPGGNSGRPKPPYNNLRRAACVAGPWNGLEMTAPCFGQEIGHNFGLEPPGSPHFQDPSDPGHSKDSHINDPFAFDFVNGRPFDPAPADHFLGDVMNNTGYGAWQGRDEVMYNAYDWEYLRQQFLQLNSTGTESNPAYTYACGPRVSPKARPPASWIDVISGQADGPLIQWGPHGIIVGPPPKPERQFAKAAIDGLLFELNELRREKVKSVYLPFADEPSPIFGLSAARSLHRSDIRSGGGEDPKK